MSKYIEELDYGEEVEEKEEEKRGIIPTKEGEVIKTYGESKKLKYPLLMLKGEGIEAHKLKVLGGMLEGIQEKMEEGVYAVYLNICGTVMELGSVDGSKLRSIITSKVYSNFEKVVILEEGEGIITGDLLYALTSTL